MADEEVLRRIEARLTRLESAISQGPQAGAPTNVTAPGGHVVDPAPWPGYVIGRPPMITNPVVGNPVCDPAPIGRPPVITNPVVGNPVADPAPWPGGVIGRPPVLTAPITGPIGDPPPVDLGGLTLAQLEASQHTIAAERARLDSMETMIKERIAALKEKG